MSCHTMPEQIICMIMNNQNQAHCDIRGYECDGLERYGKNMLEQSTKITIEKCWKSFAIVKGSSNQ